MIGGGIIGASVALHLARLGWTDTVVLERSRVASGTSWHAAGLMTRTRGTHVQTELASYSRDFYRDLAALSGIDVGYYPNGSLSVARTPERLTELRYALTLAHHHGLPARELTPDEIAAVSPLLAVERPRRRRALRGRRDGQPGLGRPRDGQGGPRPRRALRRGRARHRLPARRAGSRRPP